MNVWLVNEEENLPIDYGARLQRMGLLAYSISNLGHNVIWWESTFNHQKKEFRSIVNREICLNNRLTLILLDSCGYKKNVSIRRLIHEYITGRNFYDLANQHKEQPDVIVVAMPTISMTYRAVTFGKENGIPVLVDIRDLQPDVYISAFPKMIRPLIKIGIWPFKKVLKYALSRANGLIGTTESYLSWGLQYAGRTKSNNDRVFYVSYPDPGKYSQNEHGINKKWRDYKGKHNIICCFFGQFARLVDTDTIIDAARECKHNSLDVFFLLCGEGESLSYYRTMIENENLDNIAFPGWVNQDDIKNIGWISDVGLLAYKDSDNFRKQMTNKFSEYLSLGLAVLVQPTGVMQTVAEDNECGLHYKDANELYVILRNLSKNREHLSVMKSNARLLFEKKFSAEKIYKLYGEYVLNNANK